MGNAKRPQCLRCPYHRLDDTFWIVCTLTNRAIDVYDNFADGVPDFCPLGGGEMDEEEKTLYDYVSENGCLANGDEEVVSMSESESGECEAKRKKKKKLTLNAKKISIMAKGIIRVSNLYAARQIGEGSAKVLIETLVKEILDETSKVTK